MPNYDYIVLNPVLRKCACAFVVLALATAGCGIGGSAGSSVSEAEFFIERFPDAPIAIPLGLEDDVANLAELGFDESGAVTATEISLWSYNSRAQTVCIRFESEPAILPRNCGDDVIAEVSGVQVIGDRTAIDPKLLAARWERVRQP